MINTPIEISNPSDAAWQELYRKLRSFIAKRVPPNDVEDVVQETFLRVHRGLSNLQDDQRFGPWMYQIARNTIIDHLRAEARRQELPYDITERAINEGAIDEGAITQGFNESTVDSPVDISGEDLLIDDAEAEKAIGAYAALCVAAVSSPYREALTLTELQGLTQREAAELVGVSLSTMKSRVQRGRRKVRSAIEECCEVTLDARNHVIDYRSRQQPEPHSNCEC